VPCQVRVVNPRTFKLTYNIDENVERPLGLANQLCCVVVPPLLAVFAEVARKRLLSPGAVARVRDGRKGRTRLVLARVPQELKRSAESKTIDMRTIVSAPWPPMLWPVMLTLSPSSHCGNALNSFSGSSWAMYEYIL
jgi:hypothetical protein